MDALTTIVDVLLVVIGFGLIIFVHELGHFLAAKWARIRVLAFALGFGPAIFSFRKGLGLRWGSSAREYARLSGRGAPGEDPRPLSAASDSRAAGISPTEYRLNWLPLGGYVKMLGQEDDDPTARSSAPDSYQMVKAWKRMVVISAGVFMNLVTAAVLLTIVFSVGLKSEPAKIGMVSPAGAAASAVAVNAQELGITEPGLQPGDEILSVDGEAPRSFNDVRIAAAMASGRRALEIEVRREGVNAPLRFEITPKMDAQSRLLALGVGPMASSEIPTGRNASEAAAIDEGLASLGLKGVTAGSRLVRVGSLPGPATAYQIESAARVSGGRAIELTFQPPGQPEVRTKVQPIVEMQVTTLRDRDTEIARPLTHVAGLSPLMQVVAVSEGSHAAKAGLQKGDVFVRIGDVQYPSLVDGVAEVRRNAGGKVDLVVRRADAEVTLSGVPVSREGQIGFVPDADIEGDAVVARWPTATRYEVISERPAQAGVSVETKTAWSGSGLAIVPGSRIVAVNERAVASFVDVRGALQDAVRGGAGNAGSAPAGETLAGGSRTVRLSVVPPATAEEPAPPTLQVDWTIPEREVRVLSLLAWSSPLSDALFEPEHVMLRGDSAGAALGMGLHEFKNTMLQTYLTFARLFQGTVKVEHLKGPVGIAHVGTLIADRGFNWLLFFMAVISINLAVINFLPLPVVDGGHMVFLIYEQVTGKPVSAGVQGIATMAALVLIGSMFLIVMYNDLANLLWR